MHQAPTKEHTDTADLIKNKIRSLLKERMAVLQDEASTLSADMEALQCRIQKKGHLAKVDDLRAGRWYRTAAEVRVLQDMHKYVCEITNTPELPIFPSVSDDDSMPSSGEGDEAVEPEA